eukprot:TRINITY_DN625_c0_g1_i5.p1 TRINITY_DN625_c0_g1~~TRINITY_DN625_c0_g1_i5.p1  ORF type:complete len:116 (-),score=11.03 TRINITY_DN625_c0_g1_i5:135-482(-)
MASISLTAFAIFSSIVIYKMDFITHTLSKLVTYDKVHFTFPERFMLPDEGLILECIHWCHYNHDETWIKRYIMGSWEFIWTGSLIGSILGVYTLGGSIYANNVQKSSDYETVITS